MFLIQARIPCSKDYGACAGVQRVVRAAECKVEPQHLRASRCIIGLRCPSGFKPKPVHFGSKKRYSRSQSAAEAEALDPKSLASVEIDKPSSAPEAPKALPRQPPGSLSHLFEHPSFVTVIPRSLKSPQPQGFPKFISVRNTLASSTVQVLSGSTSETVLYAFEQPTRNFSDAQLPGMDFQKSDGAAHHLRHSTMAGLVNRRLHT